MDPLPEVCGKQEVAETADHVLDTFYPVSPTIDLEKVHVYREEVNCTGERLPSPPFLWRPHGSMCSRSSVVVSAASVTVLSCESGFRGDYPYPHAHTLYFLESADLRCKLRPEQFRTKMMMFTFGNALARAHKLYGVRVSRTTAVYLRCFLFILPSYTAHVFQPQRVLERPVTLQAVGTNGRIFQFMVFQLNTTDLSGDDGIKNQVSSENMPTAHRPGGFEPTPSSCEAGVLSQKLYIQA